MREVGDFLIVTYTPKWELGRMVNGTFRSNPNPTRVTFAIDVSGRQHGWGFGPVKVKLPAGVTLTSAEDMKPVLKQRTELRNPPKPEPEQEQTIEEPKAETTPKPTRKSAAKKRTRKTGVTVSK